MKNEQKPKEVKPGIRFSPELHAELKEAALRNGHSLQDEVIARVRIDQIAQLRQEVAELKSMVREVLDHVRK